MPSPALSAADQDRRQGLRRMRAVAGSLLVLAAVIFLATHGRAGAWGFVNAAAEAAMVGALADWFAVTALFRHPLGLPVPHTAIIPTRKAALGRSLEDFVAGNFLTEVTVREKVASAQVARRLGRWLEDERHAERVVSEIAAHAVRGLAALPPEQVRVFATEELLPRVAKEPLSPVAGSLLEAIVRDRSHHGLVDIVLREASGWLERNADIVAGIVRARAPWWSPTWLDDKVVERVQREVIGWVTDVRDNPNHAARRAVDAYLFELAAALQSDPATQQRFETLKEQLLTHPELGGSVEALWLSVRSGLSEALDDPASGLRRRAVSSLVRLGGRLVGEPALQQRWDALAGDAAAYAVRTYGREVATVISQTVERWDGREAAERIELHVGRDLQFIRINGTIVGALVGLVIHAVSQLL